MRRAPLAAALVLCLSVAASAADGPEVRLEEIPRGWVTRMAYPVRMTVHNSPGGDLNVSIVSSGTTLRHRARLPAGPAAHFETTSFGRRGGLLTWSFAGLADSERFSHATVGWGYINGENPVLTCVDSYLFRELESLKEAAGGGKAMIMQMGRELLPRRWQSYAGLVAELVFEPRTIQQLDREQREALTRWIFWMGGHVWLVGGGAEEALAALAPEASGTPDRVADGIARHRLLNGRVSVMEAADVAAILEHTSPEGRPDPFEAYYPTRQFHADTEWLFESLGGVSVAFIVVSLVLLTLILGPVNYLYVRRRGNLLLFYLITPIVACLGALGIIFGSAAVEGLGARYNRLAVLVRRAGTNDAMLFDLRGVRPGYSVPVLRFPSDTLAMPTAEVERTDSYETDLTDGVVLSGGWLRPRFPTGLVTATPVVSRLNVEVEMDGGSAFVVNGLGFRLETVATRLPDGGYGHADDVPPGGRAPLRRENNDYRLRQLQQRYERVAGDRTAFSGVSMAAVASGLPYLEDGGLGGRMINGEFLYLVAGDAKGGEK